MFTTSQFASIWSKIKKNVGNFQALEAVDRGSETQLQVGENISFNLVLKGLTLTALGSSIYVRI